jgi:hypothetical protein
VEGAEGGAPTHTNAQQPLQSVIHVVRHVRRKNEKIHNPSTPLDLDGQGRNGSQACLETSVRVAVAVYPAPWRFSDF